jgi:type II secretory pathway component PulM
MIARFRYLQPAPRPQYVLWMCSALLLIAAAIFVWDGLSLREEAAQFHLQSQAQARAMDAAPKPALVSDEHRQQWEKLARERAFRWYPVFSAIEKSATDDIDLLEFQPEKVGGSMLLRGDARSMEALVTYLEHLNEQPGLREARLERQKTKLRDNMTVISFDIRADLKASIGVH